MIAQRSISPHYNRNPKNRPVELIRGLSLWAALSAPLLPSDSNRELLCATRVNFVQGGYSIQGCRCADSLLAIPVVMFAADDQASYKVTYDGGSLSSVTSGSGLKLFAVPTGKGQGYFGDNAFQDIFYNDKKSFATPYFHRYI